MDKLLLAEDIAKVWDQITWVIPVPSLARIGILIPQHFQGSLTGYLPSLLISECLMWDTKNSVSVVQSHFTVRSKKWSLKDARLLAVSWCPLWDALFRSLWCSHALITVIEVMWSTVVWSIAIYYTFMDMMNEGKIGNDYSAGAWINPSLFSTRPGNIWLLEIIFNQIGHAIKVSGSFCE